MNAENEKWGRGREREREEEKNIERENEIAYFGRRGRRGRCIDSHFSSFPNPIEEQRFARYTRRWRLRTAHKLDWVAQVYADMVATVVVVVLVQGGVALIHASGKCRKMLAVFRFSASDKWEKCSGTKNEDWTLEVMTRDRQKRIRYRKCIVCRIRCERAPIALRRHLRMGSWGRGGQRQMVNCCRAGSKKANSLPFFCECVCVCVALLSSVRRHRTMAAVVRHEKRTLLSVMHQLLCTEMRYRCVQSFYNFLEMICWLQLLLPKITTKCLTRFRCERATRQPQQRNDNGILFFVSLFFAEADGGNGILIKIATFCTGKSIWRMHRTASGDARPS